MESGCLDLLCKKPEKEELRGRNGTDIKDENKSELNLGLSDRVVVEWDNGTVRRQ